MSVRNLKKLGFFQNISDGNIPIGVVVDNREPIVRREDGQGDINRVRAVSDTYYNPTNLFATDDSNYSIWAPRRFNNLARHRLYWSQFCLKAEATFTQRSSSKSSFSQAPRHRMLNYMPDSFGDVAVRFSVRITFHRN